MNRGLGRRQQVVGDRRAGLGVVDVRRARCAAGHEQSLVLAVVLEARRRASGCRLHEREALPCTRVDLTHGACGNGSHVQRVLPPRFDSLGPPPGGKLDHVRERVGRGCGGAAINATTPKTAVSHDRLMVSPLGRSSPPSPYEDVRETVRSQPTTAHSGHDEIARAGKRPSGARGQEMEAAGIEPASAVAPNRASTSVVHALISPGGRFVNDLPTGQPSLSLALRAIGSP